MFHRTITLIFVSRTDRLIFSSYFVEGGGRGGGEGFGKQLPVKRLICAIETGKMKTSTLKSYKEKYGKTKKMFLPKWDQQKDLHGNYPSTPPTSLPPLIPPPPPPAHTHIKTLRCVLDFLHMNFNRPENSERKGSWKWKHWKNADLSFEKRAKTLTTFSSRELWPSSHLLQARADFRAHFRTF